MELLHTHTWLIIHIFFFFGFLECISVAHFFLNKLFPPHSHILIVPSTSLKELIFKNLMLLLLSVNVTNHIFYWKKRVRINEKKLEQKDIIYETWNRKWTISWIVHNRIIKKAKTILLLAITCIKPHNRIIMWLRPESCRNFSVQYLICISGTSGCLSQLWME